MTWFEFFYQYIIGGAFMLITILVCFKPGGADIRHPSDRKTLKICVFGFVGYCAAHALWIVLAGMV